MIRSILGHRPSVLLRPLNPPRFNSTMSSSIVLPHDEIQAIWFGGHDFQASTPPPFTVLKRWFVKDEELDTTCQKYQPLVTKLVTLPIDDLLSLAQTPRESLTLLLLLDQFPRNFSRASPYPFTTTDPIALVLTQHFILKQHHDKAQPPYKRMWYYLPLSHSESIANQELAVSKFAEMCWDTRQTEWSVYVDFLTKGLESAWKHYEIVAKFGRYPHRNAVLGRESTKEELKYLQDGGETFGG